MNLDKVKVYNRLVFAILAANLLSVGLLINRILFSDSYRYAFMLWNILLAMVPVILAFWLVQRIKSRGWLKPPQIILSAVWLAFLPNSFYMMTDFIHLRQTYEASILYDITMLSSFMINGLILGFISLLLVHKELVKRLTAVQSSLSIGAIILISSFAIYLGRFTRWNSWDVVLQPAGLLFDVSDRFVNPGDHPQTFTATLMLFLFLSTFYFLVWEAINFAAQPEENKNR